MPKPNELITLQFELDAQGYIVAIYGNKLPADYIREVIKSARRDIKGGYIAINEQPAADISARSLPPGEKIINDVNYILNGGHFDNLPSEDL